MQNKGAITLFAILFALVCAFTLSFSFFTRNVESKAAKFAHNDQTKSDAKTLANGNELLEKFYYDSIAQAKETMYLDSMSDKVVFNFLWLKKYTYKDCKSKELGLGLDLKGGMNVMMEVSTVDVVKAMAGHTTDTLFNKAIERAIEKQKTSNADFVTLFAKSFEELDPNARLAGYFNVELKEKIKLTSSNEEVIKAVRQETQSAFDRTYQIMRQRIDKFGVAQPNIQKLTQSERILVELPGVKDPQRVRKLLQGTAQLEFWDTYSFTEIYKTIEDVNKFLADQDKLATEKDSTLAIGDSLLAKTEAVKDTAKSLLDKIGEGKADSTANEQVKIEEWRKNNPLFTLLQPNVDEKGSIGEGPVVGMAEMKNIPAINALLEKAKRVLPQNLKLLWTAQPVVKGSSVYQLVAIKTSRNGEPVLEGDVIVDAKHDVDQSGKVVVSMVMNAEGARKWKNITAVAAQTKNSIAIVLDDYVYSFPKVSYEIAGGRSEISGNFSVEEATDLANVLKAGKLPAPAKIVQEAVVGPTLGQEAITSGVKSFALAFLIIFIYIFFFYSRAGIAANIALLVNMFFLIGVLASIQAVLTLPGIAGVVLTMAMAVDANVIIYERIKEELRSGKGLHMAITEGYKNAYSAIIDGNVTTLLTGIVLMAFGSGPIQGFAITLCLGILTSLFTSIFITRLIFIWMEDRKMKITFYTEITKNFLANVNFDFIGKRKIFYGISIVFVLITTTSLVIKGLNYGVDFTGGRTYVVRFDKDVKVADVRDVLEAQFEGIAPEVKTFGSNNQVKITTKYLIEEDIQAADPKIDDKLYEGCKTLYSNPIDKELFLSENAGKEIGRMSKDLVGPTMADDIKRSAILAVTIALLMIFLYIAIRFKHWQFGAGGFISLFHDAFVTIGAFSLFSGVLPFTLEVDQQFIAAVLTIIGYSINDTVIIFDRVREYRGLYPKRDLASVMNGAMNSTLSRTVNTTGSTLIVLLMMFIFGGGVIRGFIFALLFGVFIGVYSSLFVACPIAYDLMSKKQKKIEE